MIGFLRKEDLDEAATLFVEGAAKQVPPVKANVMEVKYRMRGFWKTLVSQGDDQKINGLLSFWGFSEGRFIELQFIYAREMRKGIGTALMSSLADYALKENKTDISCDVSSTNINAMKFYEKLGFEKYDEHMRGSLLVHEIKASPEKILENIHKQDD